MIVPWSDGYKVDLFRLKALGQRRGPREIAFQPGQEGGFDDVHSPSGSVTVRDCPMGEGRAKGKPERSTCKAAGAGNFDRRGGRVRGAQSSAQLRATAGARRASDQGAHGTMTEGPWPHESRGQPFVMGHAKAHGGPRRKAPAAAAQGRGSPGRGGRETAVAEGPGDPAAMGPSAKNARPGHAARPA